VKQLNEELFNYVRNKKALPKGKNITETMKTIIWISQTENTVMFDLL
jgi:hypothetical protein